MWFSKFSTKKNFIKKVDFSIDNDLQYFPPKNHFLYWKNGFQKKWRSKKKFSQQHESVSRSTPLYRVAEKTSKSAKILHMGISTKTRKTRLSIVKRFFAKQHYQWVKVQKFAGRLRVKDLLSERGGLLCKTRYLFYAWIEFFSQYRKIDLKKDVGNTFCLENSMNQQIPFKINQNLSKIISDMRVWW